MFLFLSHSPLNCYNDSLQFPFHPKINYSFYNKFALPVRSIFLTSNKGIKPHITVITIIIIIINTNIHGFFFWWGNLKERDHWGYPDVYGRITLRWIFRKWDGLVGTGWSWLRIGTVGGHL